MTHERQTEMRLAKLTALCKKCGETCKQWFSQVSGMGWNCLWCGYLTEEQITDAQARADPTYSDGSPVRWAKPPRVTTRRNDDYRLLLQEEK